MVLIAGFNMAHYGMGKHIQEISPDDAIEAVKWAMFEPPISMFCMAFVKLSICLLLVRLGISRFWQIVLGTLIGMTFLDTIVNNTIMLSRCSPIESTWNPKIHKVCHYSIEVVNENGYIATGMITCAMELKLANSHGAFAILTDIFVVTGSSGDVMAITNETWDKIAPHRPLLLRMVVRRLWTISCGVAKHHRRSTISTIVKTVLIMTVTDASLNDFTCMCRVTDRLIR